MQLHLRFFTILMFPLHVLSFRHLGECNQKKRGKEMVVKDHNSNDQIIVCLQKNGKYMWRMHNGNSYGNFFNPADDCSDLVEKVPSAKNGVYWIKTDNGPKKAWCDVITDGGGFMLIGVKDTPVTWSIPSNPSLVLPQGRTQWSSAFGDKKVLDFRVQISTSSRFNSTQAHWYYRFQAPRKLTSLLLRNKGDCSHNHPGIGHVAYVKDLKNNKIVSKKFKCSRFGAHFFKGLGWEKLNSCFGKPCSKGFAHIGAFQYDSAGSFSYSVVAETSGIRHNSTAFLGCDNGECCACFGPDSKQDYCAPRCQAINGGTILRKKDSIKVWFWIRSSLPKRIWRKCMEFKKNSTNGRLETWHVGETGRKEKGPCSVPGEVKLHDGVAVVPGYQTMRNLPNIEGLLVYRSDEGKLYLRGKSQWKSLQDHQKFIESEKVIGKILGNLTKLSKDVRRELTGLKKENENLRKDLNNFKTSILQELKESIDNLTQVSCKNILQTNRNANNGAYKIKTPGKSYDFTDVYCQMSPLPGCSGGGWTMAMKINGKKGTFKFSSKFWSNKETYNLPAGKTGFDNQETKTPVFWTISFNDLCIGMKVGRSRKFISIRFPATSLYDLFEDTKYRPTSVGRKTWKSLITGSSMQPNCNREGFNIKTTYINVRLGILGNNEKDCASTDTFIGLGSYIVTHNTCKFVVSANSAGNVGQCWTDNGNTDIKAMAYILVR